MSGIVDRHLDDADRFNLNTNVRHVLESLDAEAGPLDFLAQSWAAAAIMLESEETTGAAAMRAALGTDVSGIAQLAHAHCDAQRMYSALYLRTF